MKKVISLILCVAMLLAMAACGGAPAVEETPAPTPAPTPTPTPAPDPLELALEEFEAAIDAFEAADDLKASVTVDTERLIRGCSFPESISEQFRAEGLQGDSPIIQRIQDRSFCGQEYTYEYVFAGDKIYLNGSYSSPISFEDYLAGLYPLHLFDADNFSSVSLEGDELVFEDPSCAEDWLGDEVELISAEARARFSDGSIDYLSYNASYEQGLVDVSVNVSLEVESFDTGNQLRAFVPAGFDIVELEDIRIAELFDRAILAAEGSTAQTSSSTTVYTVTAGEAVVSEQSTLNSYGSGEDTIFKEEFSQIISEAGGNYQFGYTGSYKDGIYTTVADGETTEEKISPDELDTSFVLNEFMFSPDMLDHMELREINGYYYLEFGAAEELGEYTQALICNYLYGDETLLDSMAIDYSTDKYFGWLSFDADSLLPVSYGLEYSGRHTIGALSYPITLNHYVTCNLASQMAYENITGEKAEESEPENKASPLFYKVSGENGQEMWLLGTIHIGDERTAYLPESIYTALESSDALAVEIDISNIEKMLEDDPQLQEAYVKAYIYSDTSTVADHIDAELYERAMDMLRACGAYIANTLEYMKPTVLGGMLESAYLDHCSVLSSEKGVDMRLISLAQEKGIEIREVETIEVQLDALYGRSDLLQECLLLSSVEYGREEYAAEVEELFELWCEGDEDALRAAINSEYEDMNNEDLALYEEYVKAMSTDRNTGMHTTAVEYLESGETIFYAVGLAHLLAEDGLVQSLRNAGYTVELVK